ncbi:hypothetical protein HDU98_000487 [Podochytrium sp. JEL0797]|nr:hypothetical protein HDU98_000487 [Podochytrium sp. JEL0797]
MMLQYQKWGHQVFSKLVFKSFVEGTERVCRERDVKVWRDALLTEERRRQNGFYDDEVIALPGGDNDIQLNDQHALQNQAPLATALAEIDNLNDAEAQELDRIMREAESSHLATGHNPSSANDEFDFDTAMASQLGSAAPVRKPAGAAAKSAQPDEFDRLVEEAEEYQEDAFDEAWMYMEDTQQPPAPPKAVSNAVVAKEPVVIPAAAPTAVDETMPSKEELEAFAAQVDWDDTDF